MSKVSQTVDNAVKEMYAKMARAAARRAVSTLDFNNWETSETAARCAEKWLRKAGAQATKWYFSVG